MKKIFWLIFLSLLALTACGRKGPLDHPKDEKRPKFTNVVDEEPNLKFPKNMQFNQQNTDLQQDPQPNPLPNQLSNPQDFHPTPVDTNSKSSSTAQ